MDRQLGWLRRRRHFHAVADKARWPELAALRERIEADPVVVYATALQGSETLSGNGACAEHISLDEVIERDGN